MDKVTANKSEGLFIKMVQDFDLKVRPLQSFQEFGFQEVSKFGIIKTSMQIYNYLLGRLKKSLTVEIKPPY